MKYDNDQLEDLCSEFDLVSYIGNKEEIKMQSGRYFCRCPFHSENTASFMITNDTGRFYCFGCGKSGSAIDYIIESEHLSFDEAVEKVANATGHDMKKLKQCESLSFYKTIKRISTTNQRTVERVILPDDYMDRFSDIVPQIWLDEGISESVIKKYEIRVDENSNRIVYPVYNSENRLIGVKGRTLFAEPSKLGISKYMNYQKIGTVDYFMGMHQNKNVILSTKKCVIFEGIKSVMKFDDIGHENGLAAETSCLNDEQVKLLIKMGVKDVTIAFDSDVKLEKIKRCTHNLRKFTNVYAVIDRRGLLGEKESPIDRGEDVWNILYDDRIRL